MIWKRLIHPNVVPFLGVTSNPLQIVSEWMSDGNLTTYVKLNPYTNRVILVSPLFDLLPKRGLNLTTVGRCCNGA